MGITSRKLRARTVEKAYRTFCCIRCFPHQVRLAIYLSAAQKDHIFLKIPQTSIPSRVIRLVSQAPGEVKTLVCTEDKLVLQHLSSSTPVITCVVDQASRLLLVRRTETQSNMEHLKIRSEESSVEKFGDHGRSIVYPYVLRAFVVLNVPKIINSEGPDAALSAEEICAHLANSERASSVNLAKILEVLSCYGLLSRTVEDIGNTMVPKYGLTPLSQDLATDTSPAADWLKFTTAPEIFKFWSNIHESVLDPDEAVFVRAYGKGIYQYLNEDVPELGKFHVKLLGSVSHIQLQSALEHCEEDFRSLTGTLVDVGGSQGATAAIIASKYPNIKCVTNFDLPHVVSGAPSYRGVEHVGGSFLDFVPKGDMLFAKFVFLNWNEEQLVRILRNCYDALPAEGGKMIVVDGASPDDVPEENKPAKLRATIQNLMSTLAFKGANSRTVKEQQAAAEAAGFASWRAVTFIDTLVVFEAVKAPIVG